MAEMYDPAFPTCDEEDENGLYSGMSDLPVINGKLGGIRRLTLEEAFKNSGMEKPTTLILSNGVAPETIFPKESSSGSINTFSSIEKLNKDCLATVQHEEVKDVPVVDNNESLPFIEYKVPISPVINKDVAELISSTCDEVERLELNSKISVDNETVAMLLSSVVSKVEARTEINLLHIPNDSACVQDHAEVTNPLSSELVLKNQSIESSCVVESLVESLRNGHSDESQASDTSSSVSQKDGSANCESKNDKGSNKKYKNRLSEVSPTPAGEGPVRRSSRIRSLEEKKEKEKEVKVRVKSKGKKGTKEDGDGKSKGDDGSRKSSSDEGSGKCKSDQEHSKNKGNENGSKKSPRHDSENGERNSVQNSLGDDKIQEDDNKRTLRSSTVKNELSNDSSIIETIVNVIKGAEILQDGQFNQEGISDPAMSQFLDSKKGDDDLRRPEKVKSRWRRNSELERVGVFPLDHSRQPHLVPILEEVTSPTEMPPPLDHRLLTDVNKATTLSEASKSQSENSMDIDSLPCNTLVVREEVPKVKEVLNSQTPAKEKEKTPHFDSLDENVYLFERKKSKSKKEVRRMVCDCTLTKDERRHGRMGCLEDCLNRLLMIECGSRCLVGDGCANKRFYKKQYANIDVFKTEKKGWGLKANDNIPSGTFIMEYVGEVLSPLDFKQRVKQYARENIVHHYFMALKSDEIIDATGKGNVSRFINHSCDPNCETQKWTVNGELRIGFFSIDDIKQGEELTFDYQFQRYGREAQRCYCEASNCRGFIGGEEKTITLKGSTVRSPSTSKRKRNSEERKREEVEDLALEEELEKLSVKGGLRNRDDTLMLARLMVRAETLESRVRLLDIIQRTREQACLRLFLDYHGLTLLWSWMVDLGEEASQLKTQILLILDFLPINNKTILLDSKVLNVVQKWAAELAAQPASKAITPSTTAVERPDRSSSSTPSGNETPSQQPGEDGADGEAPDSKKARLEDPEVKTVDAGIDSGKSESRNEEESQMEVQEEAPPQLEVPRQLEKFESPYGSKAVDLWLDSDELSLSDIVVASIVRRLLWETCLILDTPDSPKSEEEEEEVGTLEEEEVKDKKVEALQSDENVSSEVKDEVSKEIKTEEEEDVVDTTVEVRNLAGKLLNNWISLKEVFRIPRLEHQKRKEDERAAGGLSSPNTRKKEDYPQKNPRDWRRDRSPRSDRYSRGPEPEEKSPRIGLLPIPPKMSKAQRRHLFAMEVQQRDQEEAIRRQQQEYELAANMQQSQQHPEFIQAIYPIQGHQIDYVMTPGHPLSMNPDQYNSPMVMGGEYAEYGMPGEFVDYGNMPGSEFQQQGCGEYPGMEFSGLQTGPYQQFDPLYHQQHFIPGQGVTPPGEDIITPQQCAVIYPEPNPNIIYPPITPIYHQPVTFTSTAATIPVAADIQSSPFLNSSPAQNSPNTTTKLENPSIIEVPHPSEIPLPPCSPTSVSQIPLPPLEMTSQPIPSLVPPVFGGGSSAPQSPQMASQTLYSSRMSRAVASSHPAPSLQATVAPHIMQAPQSATPVVRVPLSPTVVPSASSPLTVSATALVQHGHLAPAAFISQHGEPKHVPVVVQASPTVPSSPITAALSRLPQSLGATAFVPEPSQYIAPTPQGAPLYYVQSAGPVVTIAEQPMGSLPVVHLAVAPNNTVLQLLQEEEVEEAPPPVTPPPTKPYKLPPHWKTAKDPEGNTYFYHSVTRQTQWDPPTPELESEENMDLGTPTFDEPKSHSKKKTTTALADTSSETAKRIKESFRSKMSGYVVQCLNPYRKPDCKNGRISSTEDFKHLARKLTHFVMAKELKHCKNVEDLECNENVKHKAKDFVHKYMVKFQGDYKKDKLSPRGDY